jgi:alpha-glucosidase
MGLAVVEQWWRHAVVYEVYPRSAADGNGDGVGDLVGLPDRLPHFADLGVDALWLTPIYPSGGVDGGYDVSDYDAIDPVYGGREAFDAFLAEAHGLGLKVLMDFVPNHTSDDHPWFVESRSSKDSPKRDWYLWADPGPNGSPPNNWLSAFGGPGWTFDPATGQYYCTSFYPQQVDLNWRNPQVRRAVIDAMRRWVERGVDGFRIDVVMKLAKDPGLRDNPLKPDGGDGEDGQILVNSQNHPDVHAFVREIRDALGPDTCLLGEVWIRDLTEIFKYLAPGELDLAFNFLFTIAPWDASSKGATIELAETLASGASWPCYHLSNHDGWRHPSVIGQDAVRAAAVLLLTLRGTPILYLGEEIGMENVEVPEAMRVDKVGRDVVRTPMQWDAGPNAGFCPPGVTPWLPVSQDFAERNVERQSQDPDSVLSLYRRMLAFRRRSRALRSGSYARVPVDANVLAYLRETREDRVFVAVNFGEESVELDVPAGSLVVATRRGLEGQALEGSFTLGGNEAVVVQLD